MSLTGHTQVRRTRRTLLGAVDRATQRALAQEKLEQMFQHRYLLALKQGLPMPEHIRIADYDETATETVDSEESLARAEGVSVEEMKRREELARREGRLEGIGALAGEFDSTHETTTETATTTTGGGTNVTISAAASSDAPEPQPVTAPAPSKVRGLLSKFGVPLALGAGLLGGPLASWGAKVVWDRITRPAAVAPEPVAKVDTPPANTPSSDATLLQLLKTERLNAPRTDLGAAMKAVFEKDPAFRARIMDEVEKQYKGAAARSAQPNSGGGAAPKP